MQKRSKRAQSPLNPDHSHEEGPALDKCRAFFHLSGKRSGYSPDADSEADGDAESDAGFSSRVSLALMTSS